jgi:hypothetical protein
MPMFHRGDKMWESCVGVGPEGEIHENIRDSCLNMSFPRSCKIPPGDRWRAKSAWCMRDSCRRGRGREWKCCKRGSSGTGRLPCVRSWCCRMDKVRMPRSEVVSLRARVIVWAEICI